MAQFPSIGRIDYIRDRHLLTQTFQPGVSFNQHFFFTVLSALDDIQHDELMKKEHSLRAQTIQEILSSEVNYLKQLEIIMEVKELITFGLLKMYFLQV